MNDGGVMSDLHPTHDELERFMLGRLSQQETRRVILHLLPGCARCNEVTSVLWHVGEDTPEGWPGSERYERTMDGVFDRVRSARAGLEEERAEAPRLLAELERLPSSRWPALVQSDRRFHTWGFCELLIDRADSEVLAGLAVNVAGLVDAAVHPPVFVEELRSRAWAALAGVRRRAGDLEGAEEAFRHAESHLLRGTGDRLERARLLEQKAALRHAQERPAEAARLISRAILLYRRAGQWDQVGRILIGLGRIRTAAAGAGAVVIRGRLRMFLDLMRSRFASRAGR